LQLDFREGLLNPQSRLRLLLKPVGRRDDYRRSDIWDPWTQEKTGWKSQLPSSLPVSYSGIILLACVVVFLLSLIVPYWVYTYLALNTQQVLQMPWTLITYMFVHANFSHLFWNMLILFFFGVELERRLGGQRFLAIYVLSGIVAALAQMAFAGGIMVGASGALYGVLGCLAIIAPELRVLLFFVLPISIRAMVVLYAAIDFLSLSAADSIAHMAHIGGLLVGLAYGYMLVRRPKYYYNL
jgi:membrane associated rhomboid family serine protease